MKTARRLLRRELLSEVSVKAGLLPTRVEPRKNNLSSLMVKGLFIFQIS